MKIFFMAVIFLLAGYLLGGWKPNAELKKTQDDLESLQRQLKDRAEKGRSAIQGVTRMLEIPDGDYKSRKTDENEDDSNPVEYAEGEDESGSNQVGEVRTDRPRPFRPWRRRGGMDDGKTFEERIQVAVDAWTVRSELAREGFVEQNKFDEDASLQFTTLINAMNLRIENAIATWADRIEQEGLKGEEIGIRIMNDITSAMALTYDEMDRTLPEGWREVSGENFKLSSQIDPRVALPLAGVEDKLNFR